MSARRRAVSILSDFFAGNRRAISFSGAAGGLSSPDSDFLRELVLGVLRHRASLDDEIARHSRFPLSRLKKPIREILEIGLFQLRHLDRVPARAAVHESVEMARGLAGEGAARLVNGVLRSALRSAAPAAGNGATATAAELACHYSHPEFLVERWLQRFGAERTRSILAADNERSRLHLLADSRRSTREVLASILKGEGVETEPLAVALSGLSVKSGNPIRTKAFDEGLFYIADAGSQVLPTLLPAGRLLADLAAAPGGKTVSAIFSKRFEKVFAFDRSLDRLGNLLSNRHRMPLESVQALAADLSALPLSPSRFERVLLDAPCSGSGTLRKNPEIRHRLTPEALPRLAATQRSLLEAASSSVAPGGYLLYSTCSLEAEENEEVAGAFLDSHPEFEAATIEAPPELARFVEGSRFRIFPDQESDGFTAHLFRKR
jgi:16S rRNA (cytosine967-C5)-methyltransferase